MYFYALLFDEPESMRRAADRLWNELKISGELSMHRSGSGAWRLDISSEKALRSTTLEHLGGRPLEREQLEPAPRGGDEADDSAAGEAEDEADE